MLIFISYIQDPSVKAVSGSESGSSATPAWLSAQHVESMTAAAQNPIVQQAVVQTVTQAALQAISGPSDDKNVSWLTAGAKNQNGSAPRDEESASVTGSEISIPVGIVELKEIERWAKRLRVAYMSISAVMALAAFMSLGSDDLGVMFMALYVWFFALLIFCSELALRGVAKLIAQNFGFMYNPAGRIIFFLFIAVMCYELGLLGKIVMGMLTAASIVHIYVIIMHPAFEEYVRKKHYYNVQLSAGSSST